MTNCGLWCEEGESECTASFEVEGEEAVTRTAPRGTDEGYEALEKCLAARASLCGAAEYLCPAEGYAVIS